MKASPSSSAPAGCSGWLVTCRHSGEWGGRMRREGTRQASD